MTPNKYRSFFTGQQIDTILSDVKNKLGSEVIKNDFTGGADFIASAETVKTLNTRVLALSDPNYFKTLLLSVEDNNIYTNAEKAKIASLALTAKFVGTFSTAAARDAATLPSLSGNEIAFVVDDGSGTGTSGITRWNAIGGVWENARFTGTNIKKSGTVVASGGTIVVGEFDLTQSIGAKVTVGCKNAAGSVIQIKEVLFGRSTGGVYFNTMSDIGNSSSMFTVSVVTSGNKVQLVATTALASLTFSSERTALV